MTRSGEEFVKVQLGSYNRKTGEWCPGLGHPKTGDRSVDGSWVFFNVKAETQEEALEQVKRYCKSKKAKFHGMFVELRDGKAFLSAGTVITDY